MSRVNFVWVFVVAASLSSPGYAQNEDEVKRLKGQVELLQAKLEAATLKIEKLEKELTAAKSGNKGAGDKAGPIYVRKSGGGKTGGETEVKFVLEKISRQNAKVTFDLSATLTKGDLRGQPIQFGFYIGTDQDGNRHEGRVNLGRQKGNFGVKISPALNEATPFSVPIELPASVKSFRKLQ
ncbi:MAG TPA: hypothetical protein VGE74_24210, partial [Gemmata sp.]